MVGRDIKEKFPRIQTTVGETIFEVRNLNAGRMVRDVSFKAHAGEIVGIAGLMGAGRTETTRAIFGRGSEGKRRDSGGWKDRKDPWTARCHPRRRGSAPEDRKKDGLCTKLSVRDNIALPNLDLLAPGALGVVRSLKDAQMVEAATKDFQIKMPNARSMRRACPAATSRRSL